ncbi:MAG: adenylyl-sulfate kinase [Anaerohalosphaeraceae bacterium]
MPLQPEKPAFVLWLTGLSGSGKTTLADRIAQILTAQGRKVERLDGDTLRSLFPNTGFDRKSRDEHIRRVGWVASRLEHHGVIVIASFISPYRDSRDFVRRMCKHFIEVYVKASLDECKRRDVKGLYQKAQAGQIQQFTGLDDPYEEPQNPELVIDTEHNPIDVCVDQIMAYIKPYL